MYQRDILHTNDALRIKLEGIYKLNPKTLVSRGFTESYRQLLKKLDDPHLKLPKTIHVAGTNGKGSIIAIMRSILEAHGLKVHVYTSPHLRRFNERIVLAGQEIDDVTLEALLDEVLLLNREQECTFFELTTAMAFAAFVRHPADVLLLETGLGGRLDCTNVIEAPEVCVISRIDYDHMDILGERIEDIAREKAGIIKENSKCVLGYQGRGEEADVVERAVLQRSSGKRADAFYYKGGWEVTSKQSGFDLKFLNESLSYSKPNLAGEHQVYNAGAAICALKLLSENIPELNMNDAHVDHGLRSVLWKGRMQKLKINDFTNNPKLDSGAFNIWLDGGHNAGAGRVVSDHMKGVINDTGLKFDLVTGMMQHKSPREFLEPLLPYLNSIICVQIPNEPKSLPAREIYTAVKDMCDNFDMDISYSENHPILAVQKIISKSPASPNDKGFRANIMLAGSLYLVGCILQEIEKKEHTY